MRNYRRKRDGKVRQVKVKKLKPGSTDGRPPSKYEPMPVYNIRLPFGAYKEMKRHSVEVQRGLILTALNNISGRVRGVRLSQLDRGVI